MEDFMRSLSEELRNRVPQPILEELVDAAEVVHLGPKEPLIGVGSVDSHIYISRDGIIRIFYVEGDREVTFGFSSPGTFIASPNSIYMGKQAFLSFESCCNSHVLKLGRAEIERLIEKHPVLAKEMFYLCMRQFYFCEMKLSLINGSAREKYRALLKNRPDIIRYVSQKVIASYLGVTPQYLCYLRRQISKE